ncbi:MAG: orotate phosphoribosyltransferase [Methylococcales bacterium]|nr:orotate phosphoribosyltransferase [Methylococcales bacterium]MCK5924676.1 orotate phosphoribosyltransferase [Methylococcales bacterium]
MLEYQKEFITYALECDVLKFGEFTLKSGRISPYFFNTGLFNTGTKVDTLGHFYAQALIASKTQVDVLYGPAYKGIPLVTATAIAYAKLSNKDIPFAFNRKEAKDHGEGGVLVGAPLQKNIVIVDDVISAGTSVRESMEIITQAKATAVGVLIALDREEKGENTLSATQEVQQKFKIPVIPIINLSHIIEFLENDSKNNNNSLSLIKNYQKCYGILE